MHRVLARPRWPWGLLGLALLVLALSLVPEWLRHHRELRGEGYRVLLVGLTAWQFRSGSLPVLGGAVAAALVIGVAAITLPGARRWFVVGSGAALGLLVSGLVPLGQVGHVSRLWIGPGWALVVAIVLVGAMGAIAARDIHPRRPVLVLAAVALLVATLGGTATRWIQLHLVEGPTANWADGTWDRVDGTGTPQLVLDDGTFTLGRWSGQMEPAGINVILTGDPACPEARGFYRVRTVDDGVLWERVIDVCAAGARARDLEGIWRPAP